MAFGKKCINAIRLTRSPLARACIAEFCGTAIMIIFGCGVLAQTKLGEPHHGDFLSVSMGWGAAITFAVFFSGVNGSGHVNPAVTLAFAVVGKFKWSWVLPYIVSQILGAWIGALAIYGVYQVRINKYIMDHDKGEHKVVNGAGDIFVTGMHTPKICACFLDQVMGTALLTAGALAVTDPKGWRIPSSLHPAYLGLLVYTLVGCFALNAGCALNPARDLGPRLAISMCGWGTEAFKAEEYFFWIPIVGPLVGGIIGAILYELTIGIHLDGADDI
ncbi:unnamed protein product [Calicophoron daubneyi]|uniref:Aquaporin n=1 Tax=Calicophoron daubneyi TaxID=300641 RepID=A0AAV2SZ11_CALDB